MRGILLYDNILILARLTLCVIVLFTLCSGETYFTTNYYDVINPLTDQIFSRVVLFRSIFFYIFFAMKHGKFCLARLFKNLLLRHNTRANPHVPLFTAVRCCQVRNYNQQNIQNLFLSSM